MKSIFIKSVLSFFSTMVFLGVLCNPMVVKAAYIYHVSLTPDQAQDLDLNELEKGEYWANFHVVGESDGSDIIMEFQYYLKNGIFMLERENGYKLGEDRYRKIRNFEHFELDKVNVEYISSVNKIVEKIYYNSIEGKNAVVLNDGESKKVRRNSISNGNYYVTHTGNPTENEKLHLIKIKADGSVDSNVDDQIESSNYWKYDIDDRIAMYNAPAINPAPFSSKHYDGEGDNWWGEDSPASYAIVSYTEADGFEIKYVWGDDEPEEVEDEEKEDRTSNDDESRPAPPTENQRQQVAIFKSVEDQINKINAAVEKGEPVNGEQKAVIDGGTMINSLPKETLALLAQHPTVSLYFTYMYDGIKCTTCIPAGATIDDTVEWFGPAYMMKHYPTIYFGQDNSATLFVPSES